MQFGSAGLSPHKQAKLVFLTSCSSRKPFVVRDPSSTVHEMHSQVLSTLANVLARFTQKVMNKRSQNQLRKKMPVNMIILT